MVLQHISRREIDAFCGEVARLGAEHGEDRLGDDVVVLGVAVERATAVGGCPACTAFTA